MPDNWTVNICFHGIGKPPRELEPGEDRYWVPVDDFHRILDEVATWPAVRLSFDDGNTSDVEIALPALVERGLCADFFVLAGRLARPGSLDEDGVRRLRGAGMAIGTHGMSHRTWRGMDQAAREEELILARQRLAQVAGTPVEAAACPLGQYDRGVLGALRRHGYRRVYTSDRRHAQAGAWLQPRFSVRRGDTPEGMRAEALTAPPLIRRARNASVGLVKRWR
jgi:peptidoglycan/xylan/chitin deacetylase (PgdA/CDA1 family)